MPRSPDQAKNVNENGAGGGGRTHTERKLHGILSRVEQEDPSGTTRKTLDKLEGDRNREDPNGPLETPPGHPAVIQTRGPRSCRQREQLNPLAAQSTLKIRRAPPQFLNELLDFVNFGTGR